MANDSNSARDFEVIIPRDPEPAELRDGAWPIRIHLPGVDAYRRLTGGAVVDDHRRARTLPEADEILTPDEVAVHLVLPKKTVIALCADGRLRGAFKAGRRWRIPGSAVRRMAASGSE